MAPGNHHDEHHHRVHLVDGGHGVGGRVRHPQGSDGGQEAHRIPARKAAHLFRDDHRRIPAVLLRYQESGPQETVAAHSDICELVGIPHMRKRLIKNLSKGYKQRVGLAQSLIGNPQVLILDEPTIGLDPRQIIEIRQLIKDLGRSHTIILSSHILTEVSDVCHRVIIIDKGKIVAKDTLENLARDVKSITRMTVRVADGNNDVRRSIHDLHGVKYVESLGARKWDRSIISSNAKRIPISAAMCSICSPAWAGPS
jgi:ABC-type multidrug transport system ATPase subunit